MARGGGSSGRRGGGSGSKANGSVSRAKPARGSVDPRKAAQLKRSSREEMRAMGLSESGSDEELDAFQKKQDRVSLNLSDDDDSDDMDQDEGVLDIDDDEEDMDDDDLLDAAIEKGGRQGALAKQAKLLGRKLKLQQREDGSEDDEDEGAEDGDDARGAAAGAKDKLWGANKRAYYDADTADHEVMEDEETMKEEEAEVLRMQKARTAKLSAADYGLDEEVDEEEEEGEEEEDAVEAATMGSRAKKAGVSRDVVAVAAGGGGAGAPSVQVETVAKDLGGLSSEARLAAVMADAPELLALLQDLQESLTEVRHRVGPLLEEVRHGDLATDQGISYLEAKHLLLLSYVINIVFYLLLKAEGKPVRDHPVIARLVELRAYMEKIRPIDKQLHYQIEKLLKAAEHAREADLVGGTDGGAEEDANRVATGAAAGTSRGRRGGKEEDDADLLRYGPNPSNLVTKLDLAAAAAGGADGDGKVGIYKPPKLNPTAMDGEGGLSKRDQRQLDHTKRRSARSDLVRELAAELAGAPEESRFELPGLDSMAAIRARQRSEARASEEEDLMLRVPLSKDEAKRQRSQKRQALAGGALADDFADEVADIVNVSKGIAAGGRGGVPGLADLFSKQKVSQKFGGEATRPTGPSGDEDLPRKKELYERRAMFDSVAAKRAAAAAAQGGSDDDDGPDDDMGGGGGRKGKRGRGGEEDEFYQAAKASASARKAARREAHTAPAAHAPLPDERTDGQRGITYEIEKNRGLTPHRRKDLKNPRKKNRLRFESAVVRRKGQVQNVQSQAKPYGGEATGIKSRVVKSKRFS